MQSTISSLDIVFVLILISTLFIFTMFENKVLNKRKRVDLLISNKITFTNRFKNISHFLFPHWNIHLFSNENLHLRKIINIYESRNFTENSDIVVISVGYDEAKTEMSKIEFKECLLKLLQLLKDQNKTPILTTIPLILILEAVENHDLRLARDCKEFNEIIISICEKKKIELLSWDKKVESLENEELIYKQIFTLIATIEKV